MVLVDIEVRPCCHKSITAHTRLLCLFSTVYTDYFGIPKAPPWSQAWVWALLVSTCLVFAQNGNVGPLPGCLPTGRSVRGRCSVWVSGTQSPDSDSSHGMSHWEGVRAWVLVLLVIGVWKIKCLMRFSHVKKILQNEDKWPEWFMLKPYLLEDKSL